MANFQVFDAYGSVVTIQSSTFGGAERQIVGASLIGAITVSPAANQSVSGQVTVGSTIAIGNSPAVTFSGAPSISGTVNVGSTVAIGNTPNVTVIGTALIGNTTPSSLLTGIYAQRNDNVASFVGGNLTWNPVATDSAGRPVTKPFAPEESRIEGYNSVVSTSVTTLVAAAGAGLRNYITDFWIANTGAATTLVTFKDGAGSVLGYTIAPTTGGSNSPGLATPIRTGANATFDFQAATATSVLYATVKGFKAP